MTPDEQWDEIFAAINHKRREALDLWGHTFGGCAARAPELRTLVYRLLSQRDSAMIARNAGENPLLWKLANG